MPYKHEYTELLIPRELDRRVKLSLEDREKVKSLYGRISQRKLAKMFGVSRRLIVFIGDEDQYAKNLLNRELNGGSKTYYDKDKHKDYMKKHRRHKHILDLQNKLIGGKQDD